MRTEIPLTDVVLGVNQVPVADYRLTHTLSDLPSPGLAEETSAEEAEVGATKGRGGKGSTQNRSCYSFCMCPGGQVVPTSVDPREVR